MACSFTSDNIDCEEAGNCVQDCVEIKVCSISIVIVVVVVTKNTELSAKNLCAANKIWRKGSMSSCNAVCYTGSTYVDCEVIEESCVEIDQSFLCLAQCS